MEQDVLLTKITGIIVAVIVTAVVLVPICDSLANSGGNGGGSVGSPVFTYMNVGEYHYSEYDSLAELGDITIEILYDEDDWNTITAIVNGVTISKTLDANLDSHSSYEDASFYIPYAQVEGTIPGAGFKVIQFAIIGFWNYGYDEMTGNLSIDPFVSYCVYGWPSVAMGGPQISSTALSAHIQDYLDDQDAVFSVSRVLVIDSDGDLVLSNNPMASGDVPYIGFVNEYRTSGTTIINGYTGYVSSAGDVCILNRDTVYVNSATVTQNKTAIGSTVQYYNDMISGITDKRDLFIDTIYAIVPETVTYTLASGTNTGFGVTYNPMKYYTQAEIESELEGKGFFPYFTMEQIEVLGESYYYIDTVDYTDYNEETIYMIEFGDLVRERIAEINAISDMEEAYNALNKARYELQFWPYAMSASSVEMASYFMPYPLLTTSEYGNYERGIYFEDGQVTLWNGESPNGNEVTYDLDGGVYIYDPNGEYAPISPQIEVEFVPDVGENFTATWDNYLTLNGDADMIAVSVNAGSYIYGSEYIYDGFGPASMYETVPTTLMPPSLTIENGKLTGASFVTGAPGYNSTTPSDAGNVIITSMILPMSIDNGSGGNGGGSDNGVVNTLIGVIPVFVILAILMGTVTMFYQGREY